MAFSSVLFNVRMVYLVGVQLAGDELAYWFVCIIPRNKQREEQLEPVVQSIISLTSS